MEKLPKLLNLWESMESFKHLMSFQSWPTLPWRSIIILFPVIPSITYFHGVDPLWLAGLHLIYYTITICYQNKLFLLFLLFLKRYIWTIGWFPDRQKNRCLWRIWIQSCILCVWWIDDYICIVHYIFTYCYRYSQI